MDQLQQKLVSATSFTLENLIFSEVDEACPLNRPVAWPASGYATQIGLTTPFRGSVVLVMDDDFANFVIEGVTGDEATGDESILNDTLSELANTLVGRFLFESVPQNDEFLLGLPDCRKIQNTEKSFYDIPGSAVINLKVEDKQLYAILDLQN